MYEAVGLTVWAAWIETRQVGDWERLDGEPIEAVPVMTPRLPKPLTNPPPEVVQRLEGGTYATTYDGVFWIRANQEITGYPLDQWTIESMKSGVLHDGDEMMRIRWRGASDERTTE